MKILVIGDSCVDVFMYGIIERLAPEAPVPVIKPVSQKENPGMASNVVANLKALGADVDVITNSKIIRKVRYVDERYNQLVLRVDENDSCERIEINDGLRDSGYFDAVIISDYCKGFLHEDDIQFICESNDNVFVDTKKKLGNWISDCTYLKINSLEYEENKEFFEGSLGNGVFKKTIVTKGNKGCSFNNKDYPTVDVAVKDISGAGDTFLAGLVVEYVKSNDIEKSIDFAQKCTQSVVQKHGVSVI